MHAGRPDIRALIEFHSVGSVFHQKLTVPVVEGALGKVTVREDVPVAFIGSPLGSVPDVPVYEDT
jgi:hypothetical protein